MEVKAEKVNPYDDNRAKTEQIKEMFDSIATTYDFVNHVISFGMDRLWRSKAVKMISLQLPQRILDVATGTGDFAISLVHEMPLVEVTGVDLSEKMISIGRKKVSDAKMSDSINLLVGDCLSLPFDSNTFDCVTVAYGVRNFEHLLDGYREIYRVLRPGGMLCVVELSTPTSKAFIPFYHFYTHHIIPLIGRIMSNDLHAYTYLPASIAAVPQGKDMLTLMREVGFIQSACRRLMLGVCSIYTAYR